VQDTEQPSNQAKIQHEERRETKTGKLRRRRRRAMEEPWKKAAGRLARGGASYLKGNDTKMGKGLAQRGREEEF